VGKPSLQAWCMPERFLLDGVEDAAPGAPLPWWEGGFGRPRLWLSHRPWGAMRLEVEPPTLVSLAYREVERLIDSCVGY
jgi:hypothetical protein